MKPPNLAVLPGHKRLLRSRELDVEVVIRQIKVRRKAASHVALIVPLDGKCSRLVLPGDVVKVEDAREFCFGLVGKADGMLAAQLGLVIVAEVLFKHSHRSLEFGKKRSRDFDSLLCRRNRSGWMLFLYYYELMTLALGKLNRYLG